MDIASVWGNTRSTGNAALPELGFYGMVRIYEIHNEFLTFRPPIRRAFPSFHLPFSYCGARNNKRNITDNLHNSMNNDVYGIKCSQNVSYLNYL